MKKALKNKKRHISIAPKPKRKAKYVPLVPSPDRKKSKMHKEKRYHLFNEIRLKMKEIRLLKKRKSKNFSRKIKKPTVPTPFGEIKKDIKKINSSIKELENKEKLGLRRFTKKIGRWMARETREISSKERIEKPLNHQKIPKPHAIKIPKLYIAQTPNPQKRGFFSRLKSFEHKEAKKIDNTIEEIKEHLGEDKKELVRHIKKEVVDLSRYIENKEEKEIKGLMKTKHKKIATPKPQKWYMPTPRGNKRDIQIKPSPIYEVHVIEDLPDPYQLSISKAARRNKVLKGLIIEEERLKKKMSELENAELVYYKL